MGCGASAEKPQIQSRESIYNRFLLESEDQCGEFDEIDCVDVTSSDFQRSLPVAPFSFSRPRVPARPIPEVPCLDEDQLLALPQTKFWESQGKRRQLYRGSDSRARNPSRWTFFNDSLDMICSIKFVFDPSNAESANSVSILDDAHRVRKATCDEFITFIVTVMPLETVESVNIPQAILASAYMVIYEVEDMQDDYVMESVRDQSLQKWLAQCRALQQLADRLRISADAMSDEKCVQICVDHNVIFVDLTANLVNERDVFMSPTQRFLPMESDQVKPFRSDLKHAVGNNRLLRYLRKEYSNIAEAIFVVSRDPEIIRQIFRHPKSFSSGIQEHEQGAFRLTFCDSTMWRRIVVVDNFFPMVGGKFVGVSREDPCEVWPQLVTKAVKKQLAGRFSTSTFSFLLQVMSGSFVQSFPSWTSQLADGIVALQGHQLHQWVDRGYIVAFHSNSNNIRTLCVLEAVYVCPRLTVCLLRLRFPGWCPERQVGFRWGSSADTILNKFPDVAKEIRRSSVHDDDHFVELQQLGELLPSMVTCFHQSYERNYRVQGVFCGPAPGVCLSIRTSRKVELCISLFLSNPESLNRVLISVFSSSGEVVFGGAHRYELIVNSSSNPEAPSTTDFCFCPRSCALQIRLEPSSFPYLVVPRLLMGGDCGSTPCRPAIHPVDQSDSIPYVIAVGAGVPLEPKNGVDITLRSISNGSKIFENVESLLIGNSTSSPATSLIQLWDGGLIFERTAGSFSAFETPT